MKPGDTLWSIAERTSPAIRARASGSCASGTGSRHHDRAGPAARPAVSARAAYGGDVDRVRHRSLSHAKGGPWRASASSSCCDDRPTRRVRGDPRALEDALDRRGQSRPARADLDAHRGLRLQGRRHRRALGGARRRGALLHRAPDRLPRHPLRPRLHRDRAAGRLRGGRRDGDARGSLARPRADRRRGSSGGTRSSSRGTRSHGSSRARWSTPTSPSRPELRHVGFVRWSAGGGFASGARRPPHCSVFPGT